MAATNLAKQWRQVHGENEWEGLLDPLDLTLRKEIIHYGEFVQAAYDGIDAVEDSEFRYFSYFGKSTLFSNVGVAHKMGYDITRYLYSTQVTDGLLENVFGETTSVWMGYIAVSNDKETLRIGRRDIVIAFRGTLRGIEWIYNIRMPLVPFEQSGDQDAMVHQGFLSLYQSSEAHSAFGSKSLQQQVMDELQRLLKVYQDEDTSITVVGHSLGGAIATLCAFDIASGGLYDGLVTAFTYASPKVGNIQFKEKVDKVVKLLRIVDKRDIVPMLPPSTFLDNRYHHAGIQFMVDGSRSPFVKDAHLWEFGKPHNLEGYLHTVAGINGQVMNFVIAEAAERDADNGFFAGISDTVATFVNVIHTSNVGTLVNAIHTSNVGTLLNIIHTSNAREIDELRLLKHIQDLLLDDLYEFICNFNQPSETSFELVEKRSIALANKGEDLLQEKYGIPAQWWIVSHKGMVQSDEHEWVPRQSPINNSDFM